MAADAFLVVAFWALIAVWPVVYVGYPVAVLTIARWRPLRSLKFDLTWPSVAILVPAHNEEATIERCVRSALAQDYPGGFPSVTVGLAGCTDGTDAVLRGIADPRLCVVKFDRQGKAATDNALVAGCDAEVVLLTSAGAEYAPGALIALASVFRASDVGCAGGVFAPRRTGSASAGAEASYFGFEYRLMLAESKLGILAKASGTALAFRRSLWRPISATSDADVTLPFLAVSQGYTVEFVPEAVVYDDGPQDLRTAFRARRRMGRLMFSTSGHIVGLVRARRFQHATSLTLHKLFRWLAPWTAVACSVDALLLGLLGQWKYPIVLTAAGVGGLLVLSGVSILKGNGLSIAAAFVVSQVAFIAAGIDRVRGTRVTRWER